MKTDDVLAFLKGFDEQEENALHVAALLGDTFSLDHVLEISNIKPSKLLRFLDKMLKYEVIRERSGNDKGTYTFAKKKVPAVVLKTMEEGERKLYLSNIIDYLERELPNDERKPLALANLYLKFGRGKNRFQYMKKAADLLITGHKTKEALDLFEDIINRFLAKDGDPLENIIFIDSVISYAPIAIHLRPPKKVLPIIKQAKSIAEKLQNKRALALLELCLGRLHQCQGNSRRASFHYKDGWRLAQDLGDETLLEKTSKLAALTLFWQGRMTDAIQMYERTLGNVEEISPDLRDLWAYLMLAYCYGLTGRIARGVGLAEAIKERALLKGHLKTQAFAEAVIALILIEVRQVDKAEPHIKNALRVGEEIKSDLILWMAKPCKAYQIYLKGDLKGAREMMESAMSNARSLGQIHYPSPWLIEILWALHRVRWKPIKGYSFVSEIDRLMEWPDIYMRGAALRYHAYAKRTSGADLEEIEDLLKESQQLLRESGARIELGRTQAELARVLVEKKDTKGAKEVANLAYQTLSEIDPALFPPELLSLIQKKSKESRILHGLQGISELGAAIDSHPDYNTYLGKVVTMLTDMFGAERAAIFLSHDEMGEDSLKIAATRNFSPEELEQFKKETLGKIMLSAIENKEPLIIADPAKNRDLLHQGTDNFPIKSIACIPLLVNERVIGLIYTDNRLLKGVFSKSDIVIMTAIATQVALFLKTTTLYRELQESTDHMEGEFSYEEQVKPHKDFPQIIGKSRTIRDVLSRTKKVSETDATVLLLGATGVGKELIARAIHQNSNRADKPFIAVNVSALNENLLTSELFGHEKGAFTSAERTMIGRFEMANQGTIFLDEVGDLSMEAQVKLLRVLQEGEFERVGGTRTIRSDFRLIAATNRNLLDMVARGDFRSDLFYRISIFPIEIPPLRERKEDIPILSYYFVKRYAAKHRKEIKRIPPNEMKKLTGYSWPGNIRELEHVIERAMILSGNGTLSIPDFEEPRGIPPQEETPPQKELLPLDEVERRHITSVLNHVKWRIRGKQGASEILGLKPSTLEYRMKKLGIQR
jgi:transcriptional regulator with GAF, ATPase, and Fis domain